MRTRRCDLRAVGVMGRGQDTTGYDRIRHFSERSRVERLWLLQCLARSAASANFDGSEQCAEATTATGEFNDSYEGNLEDCEAAGRRGYVAADGSGSGLGAKSGGLDGMDLRLSASGEDRG